MVIFHCNVALPEGRCTVYVLYVIWSGTEISCGPGLRGRSKSRGLWDRGEGCCRCFPGRNWRVGVAEFGDHKTLDALDVQNPARNWSNMMQYGVTTNEGRIWAKGVADATFGVRKPSCWTCSCFRPPSNSRARLEMSLGFQACRLKFESGSLDRKVFHASFAQEVRFA